MILTTTPTIQGKEIREYIGVITAENVLGINFVKDIFGGFTDFFGGRSNTYEVEIKKARELALQELEQNAAARGADAVVGIDFDFEVIGARGSMLMINVSGTAVKF
ncbi:MAG: heavy metal-binding domain-containing protein [Patescibacteria group bacterium]